MRKMSKTAVYTVNEKEYNEAMKTLDKLGYQWIDGDSCSAEWKLTGGVDRLIYLILYNDDKVVAFTTTEPNDCDNVISLEDFIQQNLKILESFTKADLKDGMIIQVNNGDYYMYFEKFKKFIGGSRYIWRSEYDDDLTSIYKSLDIKAVFEPNDLFSLDLRSEIESGNVKLIWKRPEKIRMTIKEIEEKLGIKNLEIIEK